VTHLPELMGVAPWRRVPLDAARPCRISTVAVRHIAAPKRKRA
jgi:hypothetical protein